jgi:hypothetical protein
MLQRKSELLARGRLESLAKLDRGVEAVAVIDDCLQRAAGKEVDPRVVPRVLNLRLRHFQKTKDIAGCRATVEMSEKLKRTDAGSLYDAACFRAVVAGLIRAADKSDAVARQADAEADRAMAWLKQAVAAGYNNVAHMKQDPDLDALRQRPDFRKLMSDVEARGGARGQ